MGDLLGDGVNGPFFADADDLIIYEAVYGAM
jgi:hypothetical protein